MGGIENALKALRGYPRLSIFNLRDLPYSRPPPYHGLKRKKRGLGHRGASQYQTYPPLGTQEGRTPFYITVPREPYNQDHFSRHALPRLSLLDLQRMIDLSRLDPTQPIDLTSFCNTGLFRLDVEHERHYGFHLTEEGLDTFVTPVNIEVQYASEEVIAAIERVGGVITTRFYDLLSVLAKSDPYAFFRMGVPIPRGKKPPANAIEYYTNAAFRGYLADPQEVASARIWLAEKYGYKALPDPSAGPLKDLALVRKQPWQIFHGLEPGWLVSLVDRVLIKPKSSEHEAFYKG
ncbi:unnamed protein product [Schistocephalus solidus]|uniref:Large ribosomal subunit protein uL15m n=2 Tax=Schistocephalus solidus TaxID=70667 RepID=A0A0X3PPF6_SCHSO|nr:unnamed protein product [Schistocephalus solidus]